MKRLTLTQMRLLIMMYKTGISMQVAIIISTFLTEKEQQKEMIAYLKRFKDIMTNHQALQHMGKMLKMRDWVIKPEKMMEMYTKQEMKDY